MRHVGNYQNCGLILHLTTLVSYVELTMANFIVRTELSRKVSLIRKFCFETNRRLTGPSSSTTRIIAKSVCSQTQESKRFVHATRVCYRRGLDRNVTTAKLETSENASILTSRQKEKNSTPQPPSGRKENKDKVALERSQTQVSSNPIGSVSSVVAELYLKELVSDTKTSENGIASLNKDYDINEENMMELEDLLTSAASFDENSNEINDDLENEELEAEALSDTESYVEEISFDQPKKKKKSALKMTELDVKDKTKIYELYGGPNPDIPMSDTPCYGCGALLHCQDTAIPGYLPSHEFVEIPKNKLRDTRCQRCVLLYKYNIAMNVKVTPEEYREIVSKIKHKRALVIYVVDLTDMPNSIFKDLNEVIGKNRPIYVVGNKVDAIPKDSRGYLNRVKQTLEDTCEKSGLTKGNILKHVALVSAKTGFGVEELVTKLLHDWSRKGDVYILGCTNAGKSTLFNAMLFSDYCKSSAREHIHRATTSRWPGTTMNLLKFPILNPTGWKLFKRTERLIKDNKIHREEEALKKSKISQNRRLSLVTLTGRVGQTFISPREAALRDMDYQGLQQSSFRYDGSGGVKAIETPGVSINQKFGGNEFDESVYANSRWCFDSPGVVNPEQVINMLTQAELSVMLTSKLMQPRSFIVKPGQVMYVSGLGRIDYLQGDASIYFTVFAAYNIPIHVVDGKDADEFYDQNINSGGFGVPIGDEERTQKLPALVGKQFDLVGIDWKESVSDIVLSSIGWVAITAGTGMEVKLRAYTPGGLGCTSRSPPMLPLAVNHRGKRKRGTAAYEVKRPKANYPKYQPKVKDSVEN